MKNSKVDAPGRQDFIYIAGPWTPVGGGMFKVADYLIQAQRMLPGSATTELRPLDTRGSRGGAYSLLILLTALFKLARARLAGHTVGHLGGVHINMAERLSLVRKSMVIVTCRALGIPVILHVHAAQLHHFYRKLPRILRSMTRWIFSLPACIVVLGHSAKKFVTEELKVPPSRVEIVINGVPGPSVERRIEGYSPRQRLFFLGSDWQRKGLFDLLRALAEPGFDATRLELVVAGRGDVEACRQRARELGVENFIRFEGWADQAKAARLLAEADALVLPSYDEGLPLVILEALANGVAVVCTPVGEIPSVLSDGVNVCFVPPGDVAGIAAGLHKVLDDAEFRQMLQRNGRSIYEEQFSIARFFERIGQIHRLHFGMAAAPRD